MSTASNRQTDQQIIDYWSDWLIDALAMATQDRRFLRGDPEEDKLATDCLMANAKKAIRMSMQDKMSQYGK